MKPQVSEDEIQEIREILTNRWPWASQLDFNASMEQTKTCVRNLLREMYPSTRFKIKTKKPRAYKFAVLEVEWIQYCGDPDVQEVEEAIAPYSFWRFHKAETELGMKGKAIDSIILNAILKDMWGPRMGVSLRHALPTQDQQEKREIEEARKARKTLSEIARQNKKTRPRVGKNIM